MTRPGDAGTGGAAQRGYAPAGVTIWTMTTTFVRITVESDAEAATAQEALRQFRDDLPPVLGQEGAAVRTVEAVFDGDRRLDLEAALKSTGLPYEVMADDE